MLEEFLQVQIQTPDMLLPIETGAVLVKLHGITEETRPMSLKNYTRKQTKHGALGGCQIQKSPVERCSDTSLSLVRYLIPHRSEQEPMLGTNTGARGHKFMWYMRVGRCVMRVTFEIRETIP